MNLSDDRERMEKLPWFHSIDFGNGLVSPGVTPLKVLQKQAAIYFKKDISGLSVIDVGAWDGFNSFEAKRRGAGHVLATDHFAWSDQCWGDKASFDFAKSRLALDIDEKVIDLPDINVDSVGQFDVMLFLGVFYHLKNPLAELERLSPVCRKMIIVETHLDALKIKQPAMVFYPTDELNGDSTNWWGPNPRCVEKMLNVVGFPKVEYTAHPVHRNRGIFHGYKA